MKIEIKSRWDDNVILCGEYENIKDCLEKNRGAYLEGANLRGANLRGAYLRGAKEYINSHDIWADIIRRQKLENFTEKEWAIIGQVYIHRLCWGTIKSSYNKEIMPIFKKLSKVGFDEWEKEYKELSDNPKD